MYFDSSGKVNTETTVELALKTARERNIKYIVAASSHGDTARLFQNSEAINIICVTHANGFPEAGKNEMSEEIRKELTDCGIKVLTTTHVLSGAERGISKKFGGAYPVEILANSLRMFGQGVKVCVEVSVMALDSGLIPYGEPVIAVGGSGRGADAAVILTPAHASNILDTKIHEIICKPLNYIKLY